MTPSERFIKEIGSYLLPKGYSFKKSRKTFILEFESYQQVVYLPFLNSPGRVEVQLQFGLIFPHLENIFSKLLGSTKMTHTGYSFGTEVNNFPEIRFCNQPLEFILYDNERHIDIETLVTTTSVDFITAFEKYALPFFDSFKDLRTVERKLNELPISYPFITNWTEKHIVFGILLAWMYSKKDYEIILSSYKDYLNSLYDKNRFVELLLATDRLVKTADVHSLLFC